MGCMHTSYFVPVLADVMCVFWSRTQGHRRVHLPLADRALRAYPHLYRLNGGDRAGWQSIGALPVCCAMLCCAVL
jgi:hypothetical protein|eukprot:COSAG01_NODE_1426_length_10342_cov_22.955091_3_plen_75_part_00